MEDKIELFTDFYRNIVFADKVFDVNFQEISKVLFNEVDRLNNIINEFNEFIEEVYNHINLGDESDEFMLIFDKWQELKGSDKE